MYGKQTLKIMQSPKKALDMHIYVIWVENLQVEHKKPLTIKIENPITRNCNGQKTRSICNYITRPKEEYYII